MVRMQHNTHSMLHSLFRLARETEYWSPHVADVTSRLSTAKFFNNAMGETLQQLGLKAEPAFILRRHLPRELK